MSEERQSLYGYQYITTALPRKWSCFINGQTRAYCLLCSLDNRHLPNIPTNAGSKMWWPSSATTSVHLEVETGLLPVNLINSLNYLKKKRRKETKEIYFRNKMSLCSSLSTWRSLFQQEDRMTVPLILAARKLDQRHIFCWRRSLIRVAKLQNQSSDVQSCPLSRAGSIIQFVRFN